jgi:hypothetical protein
MLKFHLYSKVENPKIDKTPAQAQLGLERDVQGFFVVIE